MDWKW